MCILNKLIHNIIVITYTIDIDIFSSYLPLFFHCIVCDTWILGYNY